MPETFMPYDVDTGKQLRKSRFTDPMRALALGYAYVTEHPGRDFVVRNETGDAVPASRCKAIFLARQRAAVA